MGGCKKFRDTAALYAAGALMPGEHGRFAEHLSSCAQCRREVEAWIDFLEDVSGAERLPQPSAGEAARAAALALRRLGEESTEKRRPRWLPMSLPWAWNARFWAGAAACTLSLLLLLGGVLWHRLESRHAQPIRMTQETKLVPDEMDLVKHLDLLRDLETIERVVQTVDAPSRSGDRPGPGHGQGLRKSEERVTAHG
ncbi:Putative zinc-finger [Desulfacinum hydrothermale DSM 13146]|uniref:Putative zinc-finger n=1 Tax=Desulfacinum hydrothermale DSM 13146 TaxID=1121390 RepID=A0A1W1XHF6_9BACT|nr:zf-HC2 domain-containing protein [Desulfacinum hydrothermale]SMC22941.1 Putative zinc-finger [Desulfacinum hydrothermale DSM 13146]